MGCYDLAWTVTAQFLPLHQAEAASQSMPWASVHRLPDHLRFDYVAHGLAAIRCGSCHGDVVAMPRTVRAATLPMSFYLDCHRAPATGLALRTPVFRHASVDMPALTRCSTCHRLWIGMEEGL